jgi:hypothetical protein
VAAVRKLDEHLSRLRLMVERVTDLAFSDTGTATSKGLGDGELFSAVGYHFGFYSRPNDGARGVVLKADGQGNTSFLIAWRDKQYELSIDKGEVGIQNAFSAYTKWDKNGNIISTPGGSGKVQLGGDTTPDAAVLGTTFDAALDTFLTALTVFVAAANTLGLALVPTTGVTPGAPATFTAAATAMTNASNALKNANYLSNVVALK